MDPWPFSGSVFHDIVLHPDRLELRLTLRADVDMPAQLGWHPWFRKPERLVFASRSVHRRDSEGIADRYSVPVEDLVEGDLDDCFTDVDENLTITISERELHLRSSCLHWVVYDRPVHATCIEPQSGPPNVLNTDPRIVVAGSSTSEWFTISWDE
jgi:aldose 1-epimerase